MRKLQHHLPDELTEANSVLITVDDSVLITVDDLTEANTVTKKSTLSITVVSGGKVCPAQWVVGPYSTAVGKRVAIKSSEGLVHGIVELADGSKFIDPGAANLQDQPELMKQLAAIEGKTDESVKHRVAIEEMRTRLAIEENVQLKHIVKEEEEEEEEEKQGMAQGFEKNQVQLATFEHEASVVELQSRLKNVQVRFYTSLHESH
jgi:hypothetical protein